jgi:hypothetical protein
VAPTSNSPGQAWAVAALTPLRRSALGGRRAWFALPLAKTWRIALSTAFYSHPSFWQHAMGLGHPECPERLDAIEEALRSTGLIDHLLRLEARPATADELALAHHPAYVAQTMARLAAVRDVVQLDPDTAAQPAEPDASRPLRGGRRCANSSARIGCRRWPSSAPRFS